MTRLAFAVAFTLAGCGGGPSPGVPGPLPPQPSGCVLALKAVANEGWAHVPVGAAVTYASNPPASGPHYPLWARYQAHSGVVPRGYWIHNLEHGAIVLLYRPGTPSATVTALTDTYRALPNDPACGHSRALLTPDPQLPTSVAAVAADTVLEGECVDPQGIVQFTNQFRGRGPEQVCADGSFP